VTRIRLAVDGTAVAEVPGVVGDRAAGRGGPELSKEQSRSSHELAKEAVGGVPDPEQPSDPHAAVRTTLVVVAAENDPAVVAVSPPADPAVTGPPESATTALMRPPLVPISVSRAAVPAGAVQPVTADDLAAHDDATQSPSSGTDTAGVVAVVAVLCVAAPANAATGDVGSTPEYAASCAVPWTLAGKVTVTGLPASDADATLLHTDVVITGFGSVPTSDQPAGPLNGAVVAPLAVSNMTSPAATDEGTVTVSVVAFLATPVDATKPTAGGGLSVTWSWCVTVPVSPFALVTVRVTG
jgi:hypothetical protein